MWQIVTRDARTLAEIERERKVWNERQDARRMVAQYARHLTHGVEGYAVPSIRDYLANPGHDFIQVRRYGSGAGELVSIGVALAARKGGAR